MILQATSFAVPFAGIAVSSFIIIASFLSDITVFIDLQFLVVTFHHIYLSSCVHCIRTEYPFLPIHKSA